MGVVFDFDLAPVLSGGDDADAGAEDAFEGFDGGGDIGVNGNFGGGGGRLGWSEDVLDHLLDGADAESELHRLLGEGALLVLEYRNKAREGKIDQ